MLIRTKFHSGSREIAELSSSKLRHKEYPLDLVSPPAIAKPAALWPNLEN